MKREKPQQQIYRPGSGPLRKSITSGSGGGTESSESDTNLILNSRSPAAAAQIPNQTTNCDDNKFIKNNNNKSEGPSRAEMDQHRYEGREGSGGYRKQKKPEQALYKPPSAQNREVLGAGQAQPAPHDNFDHNFYSQGNGNDNKFNKGNRRMKKRGEEDNWRGKSPNRQMRQGSEPRGLPNGSGSNWQQRSRDTRSVEPNFVAPQNNRTNYDSKMQAKPPSGRRHSTIGLEKSISQLPPRFQKKLLDEKYNQQMQQQQQQHHQQQQRHQMVEDNWNGATLMFQGSNNPPTNYLKNPSYHHMHNYLSNGNVGYHTLPTRPRGRGRLPDYEAAQVAPVGFSSMPMEQIRSPCNSRPATPPPFSSRQKGDSRPQTPVKQIADDMKHLAVDERKKSVFDRLGDRTDRFSSGGGGGGNYREYRRDRQQDRGDRRDRRDRRDNYNNNNGNNNRRNDRSGDWGGNDHRRNDGYNMRHEKMSSNKVNQRQMADNDSKSVEHHDQHNDRLDSLKSTELLQEAMKKLQPMTTSLDWSEEVEMNDRLEQEALSDALTRSSSINSLVDISTKSVPLTKEKKSHRRRHNRKRSKQRNRSGSRNRDPSNTRSNAALSRQSSVDNREFKAPMEVRSSRRRRNSRDRRDSSYDRHHHNSSRDCSFERHRKSSTSECENWREEIRSRQNSERSRNNSETSKLDDLKMDGVKKGGVLYLPKSPDAKEAAPVQPRYPDVKKTQQKSLFDPNNPGKPIIVKAQSSRASTSKMSSPSSHSDNTEAASVDNFGNTCPYWYNESSDQFKSCHYPELLLDIRRADYELQSIIISGYPLMNNPQLDALRKFLQEGLEFLLCNTIKFCQKENIEQHFWRMLYYNVIEITRKAILTESPEDKEKYKGFLLSLIDEGTKYFERLLIRLEETYQFQLNDYLGHNSLSGRKGSGMVGLALVSAQKIFMFLGDLCRYKEQVNETSNYGKCRQWYIKSHEINPKNGKPYNQLAVLAVYARRKLDAVYYYMRSLMSSNPVPSARENLTSLFDENSKKYLHQIYYAQGEKKRREERLEKARKQMKQKESENNTNNTGCLRKETWIRPDGGRRVHRTTQTLQDQKDSEEEDLAALSSVEVNKRFVISYLHVQGKLITKIGLETFQEAGMQMLKEFRALLQHSPVPLPCNRFLQLLALNMFAIENTQLKDPNFESGFRSESQERALVISLQMFNLILERCVSILQDHLLSNQTAQQLEQDSMVNTLPPDANVLLPAIKIWCDWMLYHSPVWNPPPSTQDFKVGTSGDAWGRLAVLMNLLERMDTSASDTFIDCPKEGYELVRLPEDGVLYGFTPLMLGTDKPTYAPQHLDMEVAQFQLRLKKLLFFGTVFLCGLEPPVLKLEIEDSFREYISVVCPSNSRDSPPSPQELTCNNDVLLESVSGDEEDGDNNDEGMKEMINMNAPSEVRELLSRKMELERRHRHQELRMQQVKKILSQSVVSVHIEVRPRYLVPDTNCFIDHLDRIVVLAAAHCYTLMVPIVVLSELEGLAKGGNGPLPDTRTSLDPQHIRRVGESAKSALDFMKSRHQNVKCVTTKGAILTSTTFTTEDDTTLDSCLKNDDKILATCLALCKSKDPSANSSIEGQPRELVREVVLLTEDRNLRVKAYARDVPVRELPDFIQWAGLG